MPPKKKSTKGRKMMKKRMDIGDADCIPMEEMSREQLELLVQRLHKELKRERSEREVFEIERNKINSFWEICLGQLQECKTEIRRKDYEIIEVEENHFTELNAFKQKVKYLICDNENALADLKVEGVISMELAEDGHRQEIKCLVSDNKHLQCELHEQEVMFHDQIKNLKIHHRKGVSDAHTSFLSEVQAVHIRFEKQLEAIRGDFSQTHCSELAELEMRKESKISEFIASHEKALFDMKHYYDDIILVNLSSISSLKEELVQIQRREKLVRKQLMNAAAQHTELAEPLKRATAEAEVMKKENTMARFRKCEKEMENVRYENDILNLKMEELQTELDGLRRGFQLVTLDVQQKSSLKPVLLQSKLSALAGLLQQKDAQVVEVLAASRMSLVRTPVTEQKMEELLKAKNTVIQDLQYELSRVCRSRDDLISTYQRKLQEYGISAQQLELTPLEITVKSLLKQHDGSSPSRPMTSKKKPCTKGMSEKQRLALDAPPAWYGSLESSLESSLEAAGPPFWSPARVALFYVFWVTFLVLAGAVATLVAAAHRCSKESCPPPPDVNTTTTEANRTTTAVNSTTDRMNTVTADTNVIMTKMNSTIACLSRIVTSVNTTMAEAKATIAEANATIAEANATIAEANATIAEANATIAEANATIAEANATIAEANATMAEANATMAGVNATMAGVNATMAGVNATMAGINATMAGVHKIVASVQVNGTKLLAQG